MTFSSSAVMWFLSLDQRFSLRRLSHMPGRNEPWHINRRFVCLFVVRSVTHAPFACTAYEILRGLDPPPAANMLDGAGQ
jgi:hypothetical protein